MSNLGHLYAIHGFIGMGKTTFAKDLAKKTDAIRLTPDDWYARLYAAKHEKGEFPGGQGKIKDLMFDLTSELIGKGVSVILDYGFWKREKRDELREFVNRLECPFSLYSVVCDINLAKERALKRSDIGGEDVLFVNSEDYDEFLLSYEPIQEDEEAIIINTNP